VLLAWVAEKIRGGRSWARWLFLVVYVLGSLSVAAVAVLAPQLFLSQPMLLRGSGVVQFALQTIALVLMFSPTSRHWFGRTHATDTPSAL